MRTRRIRFRFRLLSLILLRRPNRLSLPFCRHHLLHSLYRHDPTLSATVTRNTPSLYHDRKQEATQQAAISYHHHRPPPNQPRSPLPKNPENRHRTRRRNAITVQDASSPRNHNPSSSRPRPRGPSLRPPMTTTTAHNKAGPPNTNTMQNTTRNTKHKHFSSRLPPPSHATSPRPRR